MKSTHTNFRPMKAALSYLKGAEGLSLNDARKVYMRTVSAIVKDLKGSNKYNTSMDKIGSIDLLAYNAIVGNISESNRISAKINPITNEVTLETFNNEKVTKIFQEITLNRMNNFINKYGNISSVKEAIEEYKRTNNYDIFKDKIEEFKRKDKRYLGGSL